VTRILIAYDGSDESRRALRSASRLVAGDVVSVISVAPALIEAPRTADFTDPTSEPAVHRTQLEEARAIVAETSGVEPETIEAVGNPAAEIIAAAEARDVELIVIGRHGQHTVARFLMGSVADRVVRHATCDVLVVR
jgi:nucleotide-binding universal stress UspA family protein